MKYSTKQTIAIISGVFIALFGGVLSHTYRPYVYSHHINDFHFADTIGNLVCVPATALVLWALFRGKYSFPKGILYSIIVFIIFEFIVSVTFDWFDIIATLFSGIVTYLIYFLYKSYH